MAKKTQKKTAAQDLSGKKKLKRVSVDVSVEKLKANSLKKTAARLEILRILEGKTGLFSIQQIVDILRRKGATAPDWTTVYRTMTQFEQNGLVEIFDFGDGITRYELKKTGSSHHHHHIICVSCRRVDHLKDCLNDQLNVQVQRLGYKQVTHRLDFFGLCHDCQI